MDTPRWHLRFENFSKALGLLRDAVAGLHGGNFSDLEREGLIQRFEYTWELAWKSLRDYLFASGIALQIPTAVNVFRAGLEHNLIDDGDAWINAMKARNQMSHEHNRAAFEQTVMDIADRYLPMLEALAIRLDGERAAGN